MLWNHIRSARTSIGWMKAAVVHIHVKNDVSIESFCSKNYLFEFNVCSNRNAILINENYFFALMDAVEATSSIVQFIIF